MKELNRIFLKPRSGFVKFDLAEFLRYRDLFYFMVLRDVTVLYKQSILGLAWAIINPLFSMIVFSIVFGRLAGIPSDGIPYPIFAFAGLVPWTYFANALNASGSSLVANTSVFTKVYFPRLIIPLTPIVSKLLDFLIGLVFLAGMMVFYGYAPQIKMLLFPVLLVSMILTTAGLGMWLSALAIQYRDVKFALTFLTPILMYAAPVVFPASLILTKFGSTAYLFYGLYPMAGVIEGFRSMIVPDRAMPWELVGMGIVSGLLLFSFGAFMFKRLEAGFADVA
jgi:lipopolysaccharide transport system permease protein